MNGRRHGWLVAAGLSLVVPVTAWPQDVPVDAANANSGGFDPGIKLGGPEPAFGLCLKVLLPGGERVCPTGPTQEAITSTRSIPLRRAIKGGEERSDNLRGIDFWTARRVRLSISHKGHVGIGTTVPKRLLDMRGVGDAEIGLASDDTGSHQWVMQSTGAANPSGAGHFQVVDAEAGATRLNIDPAGVVSVGVLQIRGGADVAESFRMARRFPAGSVVSIDIDRPGALTLSSAAYDRRVAGVVSGAGPLTPGVMLAQAESDADAQPVALIGRAYVLADTSGGPIAPGDILTTSAFPGRAMRASDLDRAKGAAIGKAMSALREGSGLVLVLISLL